MPHLSLLYGIFPADMKKGVIKEIRKDYPAEFEINGVYLVKGGEVKDWKIIGEFPLDLTPTSEVERY